MEPDELEPGSGKLRRRRFIALSGGGLALLLAPWRGGAERGAEAAEVVSRVLQRGNSPFKKRLRMPPTLRKRKLKIRIREAPIQILPGNPTRMWTYGGTFPGPTIRRPAGKRTKITFVNKLPPKAGHLTTHLHGGHNRATFDGQPGGLVPGQTKSLYCDVSPKLTAAESGNDVLIPPGGRRTYVYDLTEDGEPERGAMQWYHDHRLDVTGLNIWNGLVGMFIIEDPLDRELRLPRGRNDVELMITDRSFSDDNQLADPFFKGSGNPFSDNLPQDGVPPNDEIVGEHVLVNGLPKPHLRVRARRYRFRVLNASNFQPFNVALSNGDPMTQIATESGLMPRALERDQILIGPGERAEFVVDFKRRRGARIQLVSVPRETNATGAGTQPFDGPLMEFRVPVKRARDRSRKPPAKLRPLPEWTASASSSPQRTWVFGLGVNSANAPAWTINGRVFDPARADAFPRLDTTETWQLTNVSQVAHYIHLHHSDWYMLSRNGGAVPPEEDCLKETFRLDPGESVVVAGHFSDYPGRYVIHCHMLEHEDHGMMTQFEVVGSASAQRSGERRDKAAPAVALAEADGEAPTLGLPDPDRLRGRKLELQPRAPVGESLRRAEVYVDGKRVKRLDRAGLDGPTRVDPGAGRHLVTVVGVTEAGRWLAATREYRG